ncbi:MAG: endonuclease/exonuclease/phosphatase family protein [Actinobacteria bacterium]|nr:endonuclease/exonuclease/phosphatase family protein [Actinomycetota bacterium]
MSLRVLTWNLFHGRALPPRDEDLLDAFAARLAGWRWDVALLQEVPPWWPSSLARACDAEARCALTSRNALLPLRRALAQRRPELTRANGGGCNAILVRGPAVVAHARRRLCVWPERRVVHAVRVDDGGWFANVHASTHPPRARADVVRAQAAALRWAGGEPLVLGGDFNVLHPPCLFGFVHVGASHVDHVFARGHAHAHDARAKTVRDRGGLSDHAPLLVELPGA